MTNKPHTQVEQYHNSSIVQKEIDFFKKKNTKTAVLNFFYCIIEYHHFQNNTIEVVVPIMTLKIEGNKWYPNLFSQIMVGHFIRK